MDAKRRKSDGRRPVVLTVDDQPDQSRLIALMLREDCEVIKARTSYEALDVIANNRVDYVLTDSNTKEFSGMELARVIRSSFGDEHVIVFVSASGDYEPMQQEMEDAGANAIVTKPFRRLDLKLALLATHADAHIFFARPSRREKEHQKRQRIFHKVARDLQKKRTD